MSVTVTTIKDPLNPLVNKKELLNYEKNNPVSHYVKNLIVGMDITYIIYVNGNPATEKTIVKDNDIIAVVAKIEGEWVAVVAIIIYAAWQAGRGVYTEIPIITPISETEQTYGWGDPKQTNREGVGIPYLFGDNRVPGHVINQFVSVENNNDILNVLLGVCDHPVDSITDIEINKQPASNYRGVTAKTKLGLNNDSPIPGFNEIINQTTVGSRLNKDVPVISTTGGNFVEKIRIFITAPAGLYFSNDTGELESRSAIFKIEYKLSSNPAWTLFGSKTINAATVEAQRKTYDIDSLTPGQYNIRITRTNAREENFRGRSDIDFTLFQEIVKQELIYPRLAAYSVEAIATDQLSGGTPSYSALVTRSTVRVFNETTGYWESKRATNYAWMCYALLNEFSERDKSEIIWDDFLEWGNYGDDIVDGDYRFNGNCIVIDDGGSFWSEIQKIARYGFGEIVRRGTRYGVYIDKPQGTVSDMFTMGNIIEGSFQMQYLPKKDRANAIELQYNDRDRNYNRQVVTIYSEDYLETGITPIKSTLALEASISQPEAIRQAVRRINTNKFVNRTITFNAFVDSFAATIGDLIYFQHFIPSYETGLGGRILDAGNDDGFGNPYCEIDQEYTFAIGQIYTVLVRLNDGSLTEKVINNAGGTTSNILTLTTPWAIVPVVDNTEKPVYTFGEVATNKKIYRLSSVSRQDDFVRSLVATEYIPEIYTNNDGFIIDEIVDEDIVQRANELTLEENVTFQENGAYFSSVAIAWIPIQSGGFDWVVWLEDLTSGIDPIKVITTGSTTGIIPTGQITTGHSYRVYINTEEEGAVNFFSNSGTITIVGKEVLPEDVTKFFTQDNQLTWEYIGSISEISGFRIKQGFGDNVSWAEATYLNNGNLVSSPYPIEANGVTTTYMIKAFDNVGRESENPAIVITNLGDIDTSNIAEEEILAPSFSGTIVNGTVIFDELFSNNSGKFWTGEENNVIWSGIPGNYYFTTKYLEMSYTFRFTPKFMGVPVIFKVDTVSPQGYQIYYREVLPAIYWSGNPNAVFSIAWNGEDTSEFKLLPPSTILKEQEYEIKIVTNTGAEQSKISEIKVAYDFPDIVETFEDLSISAMGTRIPIAKEYQLIKNVGLTLQTAGGSSATSLLVDDKDPDLGPLIFAKDKDQVNVTATIDTRIQGY
jgi:hypothetical protein